MKIDNTKFPDLPGLDKKLSPSAINVSSVTNNVRTQYTDEQVNDLMSTHGLDAIETLKSTMRNEVYLYFSKAISESIFSPCIFEILDILNLQKLQKYTGWGFIISSLGLMTEIEDKCLDIWVPNSPDNRISFIHGTLYKTGTLAGVDFYVDPYLNIGDRKIGVAPHLFWNYKSYDFTIEKNEERNTNIIKTKCDYTSKYFAPHIYVIKT